MCQCAAAAIKCFTRPTVGSLSCPDLGCCDSGALKLSAVPADALTWYDGDQTGGAPPSLTVEVRALLDAYAAAIQLASTKLAHHVCYRHYVSDCILSAKICIERPCGCGRYNCDDCTRASQSVDELAAYIAPDRILSVTVDTAAASLNGSSATDPYELTTHTAWRLHGPAVDAGGTIVVAITAAPAPLEFTEAVKSFACKRVPGVHANGCTRDGNVIAEQGEGESRQFVPAFAIQQAGLIDDTFGDDLLTHRSAVRMGRPSAIQSVRWL